MDGLISGGLKPGGGGLKVGFYGMCFDFHLVFYFSRVLGSLFCMVASYAYFYSTVSVLFFFPVLVFVVQ